MGSNMSVGILKAPNPQMEYALYETFTALEASSYKMMNHVKN
jgi:hypothetical protein